MNLIESLRANFATFDLVDISAELNDISTALEIAKVSHIESPAGESFKPVNFGSAWIDFHSREGQPKECISRLAAYLGPFMSSVLSESVANLINILSSKVTVEFMAPLVPVISASLASAPPHLATQAASISSTMNASYSSAIANGQTEQARLSIVFALTQFSELVRSDKDSSVPYASIVSDIDIILSSPIIQSSKLQNRREAWGLARPLLDLVPPPLGILSGEQGVAFFSAVILTIKESNISG